MGARSTNERYGTVAATMHWISAAALLLLLLGGWWMPDLEGSSKTWAYRSHLALGGLALALTLLRIAWRAWDAKPEAPPGLDGLHKLAFEANHILLYVGTLGAGVSGVALSVQSGLGESLFLGDGAIPANLWDYAPRMGHRVLVWAVALLTLGHVGGVVLHQWQKSDTMSRMGIRGVPSGASTDAGSPS